jgi:hypothetical protein
MAIPDVSRESWARRPRPLTLPGWPVQILHQMHVVPSGWSVVCTISRWLIMALHVVIKESQWTFVVSSWKAVRPCLFRMTYRSCK